MGDVFGDSGFRFESIPDGISLRTRGNGRVDLYVNHETSKVPFPFNSATPTAANGESDFDNSQVSALILNRNSAGALDGSFVIPSSGGFQRFCSNFLATSKEGFDREILFTNEESPDYVFRQEDSWPPPIGDPDEEENGVVLALDVKSKQYHVIYGMGRHNHENNVAIPGFDDLVVLSGDDTFTSGPLTGVSRAPEGTPPISARSSHSRSCTRTSRRTRIPCSPTRATLGLRLGRPRPSDANDFNDYYDFAPGSTDSRQRSLHRGAEGDRDREERRRLGGEGGEDFDYPLPPTNGSWQLDLRSDERPRIGIDGPQWVLEYWSQIHNVFDFVRVEDIAYDKRRAWATSCTWSTRAAGVGPPTRRTRRSSPRTGASGRWCSIRPTPRR